MYTGTLIEARRLVVAIRELSHDDPGTFARAVDRLSAIEAVAGRLYSLLTEAKTEAGR